MRENWMIWGTAVLAVVVYCVWESIRTASLINWIERPLWRHFKDWDNNVPQLKKRVRNKDYQRDYYAYSRLSTDELQELRILLKLRESQGYFTQTLLDLLWKLSLPVLAFWVGLAVLDKNNSNLSSHLLSGIYENVIGLLAWIVTGLAVFVLIVLLQFLFSSKRKHMITYHVLIIDQILEDTKSA